MSLNILFSKNFYPYFLGESNLGRKVYFFSFSKFFIFIFKDNLTQEGNYEIFFFKIFYPYFQNKLNQMLPYENF